MPCSRIKFSGCDEFYRHSYNFDYYPCSCRYEAAFYCALGLALVAWILFENAYLQISNRSKSSSSAIHDNLFLASDDRCLQLSDLRIPLTFILPSLRSLIRNIVHEGGDILKNLPPDLPLELQSRLPSLLQKHRSQWREELSQDQPTSGQAILSHQNADISAPSLYFPPLVASRPLLSQQINPISQLYAHDLAGSTPLQSDRNRLCLPQLTFQNDSVPPEFLGVLPRVKSMMWTVANRGAACTSKSSGYHLSQVARLHQVSFSRDGSEFSTYQRYTRCSVEINGLHQ